jgi:hypothetical protein
MLDTRAIREHMEVVDDNDLHVGVVDRVEGNRIKLTKNDPLAEGTHHFIDFGEIDHVDGKVHLNISNSELLARWKAK